MMGKTSRATIISIIFFGEFFATTVNNNTPRQYVFFAASCLHQKDEQSPL